MKNFGFIFAVASFLTFSNCEDLPNTDRCQFLAIVGEPDILGKWQAYEEGYSPGSDYIIKRIPDSPEQIVEFKHDNVLVTNILGDYSFYYVLKHPTTGENIVALFKTQQNPEEISFDDLKTSYNITQCENGNINLSFKEDITLSLLMFFTVKNKGKPDQLIRLFCFLLNRLNKK
jgi:hypothetical protein